MTKSTITRERLEQLADNNTICKVSWDERIELAQIALAAMDSEPVAVVEPSDYVTAAQLVGEGPARKAVHELYEGALRIGDKLYRHAQLAPECQHQWKFGGENKLQSQKQCIKCGRVELDAQPAPVVLDDGKLRELFDAWFASDCSFDLSPEASEADNIAWRESYWYVWKRCRAAMLQELQKSAGAEATCRSNENVQVLTTINPAPTLDLLPKNAESLTGNSPANPDCWCRTCRPVVLNDMRFVVCPDCGNKRCPRANDHRNSCTGSNEPGQEGSAYPDNQQSPGSEPATVPGKWIPVSEQMPPSRHEVLVGRWCGEKPRWCCKWATYIPGHPDAQSSGWLIPGGSWTPTHWMELPAGPKEVK
ncbi:DUF551 domain-containing protein [Klebsiella pneumoniae]|nr:DUF551 domain-containing protein [Klebsiella pneumoniae]